MKRNWTPGQRSYVKHFVTNIVGFPTLKDGLICCSQCLVKHGILEDHSRPITKIKALQEKYICCNCGKPLANTKPKRIE